MVCALVRVLLCVSQCVLVGKNFHPTLAFGIMLVNGQDRIHQLHVAEDGTIDWRLVPMIELGWQDKKRKSAIAGFVSEDEEALD